MTTGSSAPTHELYDVVLNPFMGGGTLLEANRLGCYVIGNDINPMAHSIVRQEIEHVDLKACSIEAGSEE